MRQSHEQYMWIIVANPLTSIIETFKFGFWEWGLSVGFT